MTQPVTFSAEGPPDTVLPDEPSRITEALTAAAGDREAIAAVVAEHPTSLEAWAGLGESVEDTAESVQDVVHAYSAYRVGYHRGLDALRKNGWRGTGFVRWHHPSNRGFLRCLAGLGRMADRIGEVDEVDRIDGFLRQLDPDWPPPDLR